MGGLIHQIDKIPRAAIVEKEFAMIHFTKHAIEKFSILKERGFVVSRNDIVATVTRPDIIDRSRYPLLIAQAPFDKNRVLRVVYKEEYGVKIIITFYPGRKNQYEKK